MSHSYDAATGHLTAVYVHTGATVIEDETYTYNSWGSRTTLHDLLHNETETYAYDAESRVTGATATLASGARVATLAASYDAAGNLRSKTREVDVIRTRDQRQLCAGQRTLQGGGCEDAGLESAPAKPGWPKMY